MKNMKLYHGSQKVIERPVLGYGNPKNDYGLGFYCTPSREMAAEWACGEGEDGFVNEYTLSLSGLKVLNLNSANYTILHWLSVLISNRTFRPSGDLMPIAMAYLKENFSVPVEEYDVVRGYRADDSYFSFATAFLNGSISLAKLQEAMKLGKLGEQIVPRTQKAYDQLEFLGTQEVDSSIYYPLRISRDQKARSEYRQLRDASLVLEEPRITDILRERWQADDPRLRA